MLNDNDLLVLYQKNYAYHPLHSLLVYYWGTKGKQLALKTIIVTKKTDKHLKEKVDWFFTTNINQALSEAKKLLNKDKIKVIYPFIPPFALINVSNHQK